MSLASEKCTFLLSSYDGGEDCWEGFFRSLEEQWPGMDMPIVLNTESKKYSREGYDIRTFSLYQPGQIPSWGRRLIEHLKRIQTPYILLFLDDYWLDAPVDTAYFEKSLEWMEANPDIATFSYYPCMPGENIEDGKFERMELRPVKCEYRLNAQVSVWRTDRLMAMVRPHESPWEWEVLGSVRAERYPDRFYSLKEGEKLPFSYGDPAKGCIIKKGRWVRDAVMPFEEKYHLGIDFSRRGFTDEEVKAPEKKRDVLSRLKRGVGYAKEDMEVAWHKYLSLK